ncbi:MAG: hypothetical protein AAF481_12655 [Acidobacteriota bacterium]
MFDSKRHRQPSRSGLWMVAWVALLLLGFHGISAAGHHHDSGVEGECELCHFGHVHATVPEPPTATPMVPEAGRLIVAAVRAAESASRPLPPSRGPPA